MKSTSTVDPKFNPWVGSQYGKSSTFGARLLVLGESHYGNPDDADQDFTTFIVRKYAQRVRARFFTVAAKMLLNMDQTVWLSNENRAEVWEHVAFYNYIQELVGDESRVRPTEAMWKDGDAPLRHVLTDLRPDLVVVLGKELARRVPWLAEEVAVCHVQHPSTGIRYAEWNPVIESAIQTTRQRIGNQPRE